MALMILILDRKEDLQVRDLPDNFHIKFPTPLVGSFIDDDAVGFTVLHGRYIKIDYVKIKCCKVDKRWIEVDRTVFYNHSMRRSDGDEIIFLLLFIALAGSGSEKLAFTIAIPSKRVPSKRNVGTF